MNFLFHEITYQHVLLELTVIFSDDTRTPHSILVLFRTNFPSEKKALQDKYVYK